MFTEKTLVQRLLYRCSALITRHKGDKGDDYMLEDSWRSETPVGSHSRGFMPLTRWDYLWMCPSGALPPPCASAIGAASFLSAAARPFNLTGLTKA